MPYPSNWDTIRRQVYERDGYQCQNCGAQGGPRGPAELHAHHIVDANSGGTHDPSNLITLCSECHTATHNPGIMAPTAQPQPQAQAQPYGHAGAPSRNGRWWVHLILLVFTLGIGNLVYWLWARWRFRRWQRRATATTQMATVTPVSVRRRGGIRERYGGVWMHLLVALVTVWWTAGLGNILYALWRRARWDSYY